MCINFHHLKHLLMRLFTISFVFLITACFSSTVNMKASDSTDYPVPLTECPTPEHYDNPPNKHRTRPLIKYCTITHSGISSSSFNPDEITLYEVCGTDGNCIACFPDESGFIDFIFSSSGEFEIRLHLGECILRGFISL